MLFTEVYGFYDSLNELNQSVYFWCPYVGSQWGIIYLSQHWWVRGQRGSLKNLLCALPFWWLSLMSDKRKGQVTPCGRSHMAGVRCDLDCSRNGHSKLWSKWKFHRAKRIQKTKLLQMRNFLLYIPNFVCFVTKFVDSIFHAKHLLLLCLLLFSDIIYTVFPDSRLTFVCLNCDSLPWCW